MTISLTSDLVKWRRFVFLTASSFTPCILWPVSAMARRVNVFAWVAGDTLHTESKFSGGKVFVYDLEGNELLSGETDAKRAFSFRIPKKTAMKIVLQAGMGHRGDWTIPLSKVDPKKSGSEPTVSPEESEKKSKTEAVTPSVDLDRVGHMLEQSLNKRLAEAQDKGPTLREILGGAGYIFGLMGLAAYMHYRRKVREMEAEKKGS